MTSAGGHEEHGMADSKSGTSWRQRSTGFLAGVSAVVLVVVLLGGMAIGYGIEKSRVKHPKKTAAAKTPAAKAGPLRVVGTVSLKAAASITVTPAKGAIRTITLAKGTVVAKAGSGAASDIAANARVVFSGAAGSLTTANVVIVLPTTARIGSKVVSADATTMNLQNGTKITTTGATVNRVSAATIADVLKGSKVLVGAVLTKAGAVVATEIIVLPSNSTFA
jgi:hypothetical protein